MLLTLLWLGGVFIQPLIASGEAGIFRSVVLATDVLFFLFSMMESNGTPVKFGVPKLQTLDRF